MIANPKRFIWCFGLAITLSSAPAFAEPECPEMPCSVIRNCSSTGIACETEDRECAERAREKSLEVKCEQHCTRSTAPRLLPARHRALRFQIVWILLALAVVLASVGSAVAWVVLRKKDA